MSASTSTGRKRKLSWRKKALFTIVTLLVFFVLAELLLALLGVDPARHRSDPFVGFEPGVPLFVREGERYTTNPLKQSFFNQQSFPARKSSKAYRIFCLGGSTTYGHPYDHRAYFGTWLEAMLEEVAPDRQWEIVNCGGISYASYRLALQMEELSQYEPDLFVIYTGHNEFLEERTYHKIRDQHPAVRRALRIASLSRIFGLLRSVVHRRTPPSQRLPSEVATRLEVVGLDAYHRDDAWQRGVIEHFRDSLQRATRTAHEAGARVILVQPAANLTDFTPFKSEHSQLDEGDLDQWKSLITEGRQAVADGDPERAVQLLSEAEEIDARHAYGLWLLADALLAAGRKEEAVAYFVRAKDEDVCPLRAPSEIREILDDVAKDHRLDVLDFPQLLERKYGLVPSRGLECFLDHVHPNLRSHGDLGRALCHRLHAMGVLTSLRDSPELFEKIERRVRGRITPVDNVMALHTLAMTLSWAGKNKEALPLAKMAAEALPGHPDVVSQYGRLLESTGDDERALEAYQQAVDANPSDSAALARLGDYHRRHGGYSLAKHYLQQSVDHCAEWTPPAFQVRIRFQLGDCLDVLGDKAGATAMFREAAALDPEYPGLRERLTK
ncbi:MAG: tetratricopeptide repeat protein [Planctomycetes bacterium]|nr:tetratricopeptide repeat protein [Planctomycetota bacterium]